MEIRRTIGPADPASNGRYQSLRPIRFMCVIIYIYSSSGNRSLLGISFWRDKLEV